MPSGKTVYTIGHSNRTLEELVGLLKAHEIQAVADVRRRPFSRFRYFSRPTLEVALPECLIGYWWLGRGLGGNREPLSYEEHMLTAEFRGALRLLEECAGRLTTAVLCAERLPANCHRKYITRALEERGWEVLHIVGPGELWESPDGPQKHMRL